MNRWQLLLLPIFVLLLMSAIVGCGGSEAESFFYKGNEFAEQGRYDEAIEEYTRAIELDPNYTVIHFTFYW